MRWISTFTSAIRNVCSSAAAPFKLLMRYASSTSPSQEQLEDIKRTFIAADFGVEFTTDLLAHLQKNLKNQGPSVETEEITKFLHQFLINSLPPAMGDLRKLEDNSPKVILFVGVNGGGKTTSLAKLGYWLQQQDHQISFGAGDTFRAAAIEQLRVWSERLDCPLVAQKIGADPAAVLFDAYSAARSSGRDFLLADTAGRLTQPSLAKELQKIVHVLKRQDQSAPHEIFCVLDATLGQNSVKQVEWFHRAVGLSGLILTKLDGTAKGGIIFDIYKKFRIPICYVGFGEQLEDFRPFDPELFVNGLLLSEGPISPSKPN